MIFRSLSHNRMETPDIDMGHQILVESPRSRLLKSDIDGSPTSRRWHQVSMNSQGVQSGHPGPTNLTADY
jgi:hypothetical protein